METNSTANGRSLIAVCQLTCGDDLEKNFEACKNMVKRASARSCKMIFFPEFFDFVPHDPQENISLASEENGPFMERFRSLAKEHGIWMSLGGFHNKDPSGSLPWNSHIIIDDEGNTRTLYNKLHLFDVDIPGRVRFMESELSRGGIKMVSPVATPIGRIGLGVCHDLRFAELALWNRYKGAEILCYPSAFTLYNGIAHFEPLLRSRAIETQCYVIAANQTGKHSDKLSFYGHAMVVDPFGAVIAQCSDRVDMCFAEIDLSYVAEIRELQPLFAQRRSDLYTLHVNEEDDESSPLMFGETQIAAELIFYRSAFSFAFINVKSALSGYVLVCPKRICCQLADLSDSETADLFIVCKKVRKMIEKVFKSTSSAVCIQEGKEAGQPVEHVYVHIVTRRERDSDSSPDSLHGKSSTDDRDPQARPRSQEELNAEAALYRNSMRSI